MKLNLLFTLLVLGNTAFAQLINVAQVCQLPLIANESSGIVKAGPNSFWTHNDSGGQPDLYEFDSSGTLLRTLTLSGGFNVDWEELAMDSSGNIYIGDFGNNFNFRQELKIFKIPPPATIIGNQITTYDTIWFHYEDQTQFPPPLSQWNYDLEAMTIIHDSIYLFTKNRTNPPTGYSRVYSLPTTGGNYAARLRDSIFTGTGTIDHFGITGAASNSDGSTLVLISNLRIWILNGFNLPYFSQGTIQAFEFAVPSAKEAVTFGNDSVIWLTAEGSPSAAGFLYRLDSAALLTGLQENVNLPVTVFPNPFHDEIIIHTQHQVKEIKLFDLSGKLLFSQIGLKKNKVILPGQLPPAMYFLRIETEKGTRTFKILKE